MFYIQTLQAAPMRIKDLVMVAGARANQLVGYGLVTGIANDGDRNPTYTVQTIANMLQRFGITVPPSTLSSKNVAAVVVIADIPPFAKPGMRIDVMVASMGDAKTIHGGVLLQTPLLGADGKVYAVAQGPIAVGGYIGGVGGAGGASVQKNHPTVGQIIGGAIVEREIPASILKDRYIELILREPDFTTASRLAQVLNEKFPASALAIDATSVRVMVPEVNPIDFIAQIENLEIEPDIPARIVINERTGTIVANSKIKIASCAISHGNITITIGSTLDVSQPLPFSQGQTAIVPRTETTVTEAGGGIIALPEMPTIEKVASVLNALGLTPRDMMAIFQAMKQAGALQAELVIR